jgi:biopolymer transport protein ExbD
MAFARADRTATLADINITPLVDVMLVLLIIFMVATPMLSRALPLDLPQPTDGEPPPPPKYTATLHIDAAGTLRWDGQPMSAFAVDALMRIEAGREEMPLLQIDVEPDADYAHVAAALGRARAAGLTRIALPEG